MPGLSSAVEARRSAYFSSMAAAACEAGVPLELYDALILQESQYRPFVVSPKGAAGMSQLMPQTARDLHVSNVWDAAENLRAGARYLRAQIDAFARYDSALGAYNAGPQRIREYRGLPPFRETQAYVARILSRPRLHLALRNGSGFGTVSKVTIASAPRLISAVSSF
ncbi:lytic transglycosylase domain-containing protein [Sphingomonas sp. NFR15]|uniref:lytic transglycosylase domain-containing protein n=1 Tax=Sphingomonas sp. NFR15 TaxID=1566282 RepID=UPI00210A5C9E|nr:lytic transglycosylase domain-containing protein [Sphingomonas sp. NFR15]